MSETQSQTPSQPAGHTAPQWQALPAIDRRVAGVLVEKAKTTPDAYPMTLNGICTACNQKNNRYPLMNVEVDDVEPALDRLRALGAVALVQGSGRAQKYRHYLYDWLGVDKVEMAVMTELLLRGAQSEGELRGRAARMEPIADVSALRPVLDSLKAKRLIISLTSEGRGHVVTHNLYEPRELEKLRNEYANRPVASEQAEDEGPSRPATQGSTVRPAAREPVTAPSSIVTANDSLRQEISDLRSQLAQLRSDFDDTRAELQRQADELARLKDALGA